jgi:DNA-directed RNA polymerase I and III subunit RPAC2
LSFDFLPVPFAGDPAREVLKDACQNLMVMCQHVRSTWDKAVDDYRSNPTDMDTK